MISDLPRDHLITEPGSVHGHSDSVEIPIRGEGGTLDGYLIVTDDGTNISGDTVYLPTNWRRRRTAELEELLDELDDSTRAYDLVAYELDLRSSAEADPRVAQATGCE